MVLGLLSVLLSLRLVLGFLSTVLDVVLSTINLLSDGGVGAGDLLACGVTGLFVTLTGDLVGSPLSVVTNGLSSLGNEATAAMLVR